jgi:hypothetical protein
MMSLEKSSSVADTAMICLQTKSPRAFRDVSCEYDSGTIILRGRSPSYYDKQVAQETVRGVAGVEHVVNDIKVSSNATSIPTTCAPSHPIPVRLQSCESETPDVEFVLAEPRVLVGRAESADVRIEGPCVSRYHCEIGSINGTLWIRDLGSANGVFVNGFYEPQSHLMPGDRLTIGEASFRVEYDRQQPKCYEDVLT